MELKATALAGLDRVIKIVTKDLEHLSEEAVSKSFGGKARTVADIITEINMVNDYFGGVLVGEQMGELKQDGWITAPEDCRTKAAVIEAFNSASARLLARVGSLEESSMEELVQGPSGPTTKFQGIQFLCIHMWYHSGQFNYIQTLVGDDGWHWG